MIDSLISKPEEEVSPLLKFYNELVSHSNFRIPLKPMLEFDIRLFRAQLDKIRRSHKMQLRYIKQAAKDKANEYLMSQFANARNIITDEIKWCLKQTEDLKNTYSEQEKELKVMRLHCA
jgi:hypothetical protein